MISYPVAGNLPEPITSIEGHVMALPQLFTLDCNMYACDIR